MHSITRLITRCKRLIMGTIQFKAIETTTKQVRTERLYWHTGSAVHNITRLKRLIMGTRGGFGLRPALAVAAGLGVLAAPRLMQLQARLCLVKGLREKPRHARGMTEPIGTPADTAHRRSMHLRAAPLPPPPAQSGLRRPAALSHGPNRLAAERAGSGHKCGR